MLRPRILLVDDAPDILLLLQQRLVAEGFETAAARSGVEALRLVESQRPDLVVLDVVMPELNGFQLLRRLRESPATAELPVIMLTGKREDVDRFWGLELGADAYLTKPVNPNDLVARIRELLARR